MRPAPTTTARGPTLNESIERLLDHADERGYVLTSELAAALDDEPVEDAVTHARSTGVVVVDDVSEELDAGAATSEPQAMADPVRWYLNHAASRELLDAEQEMDLAKRYQAGLAAEELLAAGDVNGERRGRLRRIASEGNRAKEALVAHNLRLVVPTAKRYAGPDMDLLEAIQEANLGLIRAVEKFDHTKGYKFSTYAVWWIRQSAQRGLAARARTIRVPASMWEQRSKIRKARARLRIELGRDATEEELAERTGLSVDRIHDVEQAMRSIGSLDRPVGEDGDASFGDLLPDHDAEDPEGLAAEADARDRLLALMDTLPPRQRRILELRFGLEDGATHTYEEIGEAVGLTRERVRQLHNEALRTIRSSLEAVGLPEDRGVLAA